MGEAGEEPSPRECIAPNECGAPQTAYTNEIGVYWPDANMTKHVAKSLIDLSNRAVRTRSGHEVKRLNMSSIRNSLLAQ
jgi:hypothetical protein